VSHILGVDGMSWSLAIIIVGGLGVLTVITLGAIIYDMWTHRQTRDWREEIRILQLENNRYLQKVHDENTRFFRSMGLTTQQILERVDKVD